MNGRERIVFLAIPNEEVAYIYDNTIKNWFRDEIRERNLSLIYQAVVEGKTDIFQKELEVLLQKSISYMDNGEAFYHGLMMGIFGNMRDYIVKSNQERGNGRPDIIIYSNDVKKSPAILELKVTDSFKSMDYTCDKALEQIREKHYDSGLAEEGYEGAWNYGIAFFRKQCKIKGVYIKF